MHTKKELNALKKEVEAFSETLCALTDEELAQVSGGKVNQKIKKFNNPEVTND